MNLASFTKGKYDLNETHYKTCYVLDTEPEEPKPNDSAVGQGT